MKKNIKLIIIFLAIVAVLAGVLVFLIKTAPEEEPEADEQEDKILSSLLYDENPADISLLTIENEYGTYNVERVGEGDEARWSVEDISGSFISNSSLVTLIDNAATLTAQQTVVENPEDVSIYGLSEPSAKVTVNFSDSKNTVRNILIGNLTPKGSTRYLMLEGDSKVYTVYSADVNCFLNQKYDLINKVVYTAKTASSEDDTTDYSIISKMTVKRSDLDYDIVIEYDKRIDDESVLTGNSSLYVLTEPVYRDLDPEKSSDITENVIGLTASDLFIVNPTEDDMTICGLTEPEAEVNVEFNGGDVLKFKIGGEYYNEEGNKEGHFVYVDGINIIYIFSENKLPWLNFKPLSICTTNYTSNYVYDVETLDITYGDEAISFELSGSSEDDFAVKRDGVYEDTSAFKTFYQFILKAPSNDVYLGEATGEPSLTISINAANNSDLIEFIPTDSRQSIIRLNGKVSYKCATAYVERFISNIELYKNGENIISNW